MDNSNGAFLLPIMRCNLSASDVDISFQLVATHILYSTDERETIKAKSHFADSLIIDLVFNRGLRMLPIVLMIRLMSTNISTAVQLSRCPYKMTSFSM